jgi:hypothetical protein
VCGGKSINGGGREGEEWWVVSKRGEGEKGEKECENEKRRETKGKKIGKKK